MLLSVNLSLSPPSFHPSSLSLNSQAFHLKENKSCFHYQNPCIIIKVSGATTIFYTALHADEDVLEALKML